MTEKNADALFDDRMVLGRSLNRDMLLQFKEKCTCQDMHQKVYDIFEGRKKEPFSVIDEVVTREVYEHPINEFSIGAKGKLIPIPWNL